MSCKEEVVVGLEEGLFLLPSNLFNEVFLPFPQSYSNYDWKPRMWYALHHYRYVGSGSIKKPSDDIDAGRIKPRGTGVFLPARPVSSSQYKRPNSKKKQCPIVKQVFLPKEWAY
ncbi:unnamed protein product [Microthlaspi erraticum]|uniref:Uncharacterized protein n=1 Tax=Microthlaspi erraticum TaxID=1685480 RepID=A0A6D2IT69_9BRAS|nr:unnamed protein product [Microthlaspi erraticum]